MSSFYDKFKRIWYESDCEVKMGWWSEKCISNKSFRSVANDLWAYLMEIVWFYIYLFVGAVIIIIFVYKLIQYMRYINSIGSDYVKKNSLSSRRRRLSEKHKRTLIKVIRTYVCEEHDDWDEALTQLQFAYSTGVHGTAGFTPYECMFGRQPKMEIANIYYNTNGVADEFEISERVLLRNHKRETGEWRKLVTQTREGTTKRVEGIAKVTTSTRESLPRQAKRTSPYYDG
jgi:hypothetical protein